MSSPQIEIDSLESKDERRYDSAELLPISAGEPDQHYSKHPNPTKKEPRIETPNIIRIKQKLLDRNLTASFFDLFLNVFSFSLRDTFFDRFRRSFYEVFRFFQT